MNEAIDKLVNKEQTHGKYQSTTDIPKEIGKVKEIAKEQKPNCQSTLQSIKDIIIHAFYIFIIQEPGGFHYGMIRFKNRPGTFLLSIKLFLIFHLVKVMVLNCICIVSVVTSADIVSSVVQ